MDHRGRPLPESGHPPYRSRDREDYYWYSQQQQRDREPSHPPPNPRDRDRHWAHLSSPPARPDQYPYHVQQYQYHPEQQRPQSRCVDIRTRASVFSKQTCGVIKTQKVVASFILGSAQNLKNLRTWNIGTESCSYCCLADVEEETRSRTRVKL